MRWTIETTPKVFAMLLMAIKIASAQVPPVTIFQHVSVVPMTREIVLEDMSVVVRDGRIAAMGRADSLSVPSGAAIVDGAGKFLLPGLVDMHVHLDEKRENGLVMFLANGVTTVRNMHGKPRFLEWREEIRRGARTGPRIVTSSPFTSRDDVPAFHHLPTPESAREAVRKFSSEGYDLVKVVTLDKDVFFALMDEAGKLDLPVAGHNPSVLVDLYAGYPIANLDFTQALTLDEVLGAGMVSIEHLDELFAVGLARVPSSSALPELVARVRDSGVAITTLLVRDAVSNEMLSSPDTFLTEPRLEAVRAYLGEDVVTRAKEQVASQRALDEPTRRMRLQDLRFLLELLKALVDGGVTVLAGTDSGGTFTHPGEGLHEELQLFARAGLSPYQTVRAATVNPAVALGAIDESGTIEVGKIADLVLVEENPLDGVRTLRHPAGVMIRGRWLSRVDLDGLLNFKLTGKARSAVPPGVPLPAVPLQRPRPPKR